MKTLKDIGEHSVIALLTANLKTVGDDCAVLPLDAQYDLVLTSDPLIQGVHFTPETRPEQIGWKAVARVLSDFAAMGADPQYLLINLVAPPEQDVQILEKIYDGVSRVRKRFDVDLSGGDLAQGPNLELHVFGVGRVPKGRALLRSGAHPGDILYVTGPLGDSFKSGRHLTFMPRVTEGKWLRQSGFVRAMMDISDGLATDLRHILKASKVGADINSATVPLFGTLEQALYDGEDFELLFTVPADEADAFDVQCLEHLEQKFPRIGSLTEDVEVLTLDGAVLDRKAYEHFR
ncbi:MAG: thiamine-monophosphate kinase [Verrucomicrobiota bacterium]|jgi:thiamine-monophosphate kinase|nr:thiamine-monophosphate kinase [Verrucomicrobiota bacterium]